MKVKNGLDWENVSWQSFQKLCLHLAQNEFRNLNFEEYLKEGNVQDGIDLLSIQQPEGKYITIQCKKVESFSESKAKKAIEEFINKSFVKQSSIFILATSAPIGETAKKYLLKCAKEIRQEYSIELRQWDRSYIEEQLKRQYSLVAAFFSYQTAQEHCFAPSFSSKQKVFEPVKPFINRKVTTFQRVESAPFRWYNTRGSLITTLTDTISKDRLKAKHICLIADAYQGKSYLMRQTAFELQNYLIPFSPFLIELKFQVIGPVQDMLSNNFGLWKNAPAQDIIVMIDGMDEVPSDKFSDMLLHIKAFSNSHSYITLIFSCRKLFFEYHNVEQKLPNFSTLELYGLSDDDIEKFTKEQLHTRAKEFRRIVRANELSNFLYHPFYLINLIHTFQTTPNQIPNSKTEVVEQFIEKAYSGESDRRISGGKALKDRRVEYRKTIQKLAFALQLTGRNAISEEDLQLLFTEGQIELVQHNSLITAHLENWSFANALFQEHLAALVLSKMGYQEIISYISVGKKIKKTKTKWIQTIASLLSLLDEKNSVCRDLLRFLERDNIELLFTTERTKFSESQRVTILKKLLQRCVDKGIHPIMIHESRISTFIDKDKKALPVLISCFIKAGQTSSMKVLICEILVDLSSLSGYEEKFYQKALPILESEKDSYVAGKIVEVFARFMLGDRELAAKLVISPHSVQHDFRKAVYQYLIEKNLVDEYYQYGLDGLQPLIEYNKNISHAGSDYWFTQFLLTTRNSKRLKFLLAHLSRKDWQEYFDRHSIHENEIIKRVCKIAINAFSQDFTVVIAMVYFIRNLKRHQYKEVYEITLEFFASTNAYSLAVGLLIREILEGYNWEFISLIREPVFDYLLFEWEEGNHPIYILRHWIVGLRKYNQTAAVEKLYPLLYNATEGEIDEPVSNELDEWHEAERKKRENDLKYIQSLDSFKEGVRLSFKAYGKNEMPEDDMYVDFEDRSIRSQSDSNFVYRFLLVWVAQDRKATLSRALQILDKPENFEYFRASEICNYSFHGHNGEDLLKDIAKAYFDENIKTLDFKNCIIQKKDKISWFRKQALIGELFEKFELDAPAPQLMELVWLDLGGTRNFESADNNNKKSLTQKILLKLKDEDLPYFKQKVIDNLKIGISSNGVLGTHIGLCRYLKIFEATNILRDVLTSKIDNEVSRIDLLDIYVELGGNLSNVLPYFTKFRDFNSYFYFHFVLKFIDNFPRQVFTSLQRCMAAVTVKIENKVRAAQYLCTLGDFSGFKYLVEKLRQNYKSPYPIQSFSKMAVLKTKGVLNEIKDLGYYLLDDSVNESDHFSMSAKNIIIEWLQIFALKSEEDLNAVILFYNQIYDELKGKYPNAKHIFWYEERVIEKFRETDQTLLTFTQVKAVLKEIEV